MTDHIPQDEITTLNTLIATLIDSVTGYEDAAANIEGNRALPANCSASARASASRVVEELRAEVRRLGGNPEDDGSFLGKTHQRFLDLKAAIAGRDEKAIINEVERGEDYLKEKFETALDGGHLSGESRAVVERAYQSVRTGHDQVSQLKHGTGSLSRQLIPPDWAGRSRGAALRFARPRCSGPEDQLDVVAEQPRLAAHQPWVVERLRQDDRAFDDRPSDGRPARRGRPRSAADARRRSCSSQSAKRLRMRSR